MAWARQRAVSDAGARCVLHALSTNVALYLFSLSSTHLIVASQFVADLLVWRDQYTIHYTSNGTEIRHQRKMTSNKTLRLVRFVRLMHNTLLVSMIEKIKNPQSVDVLKRCRGW